MEIIPGYTVSDLITGLVLGFTGIGIGEYTYRWLDARGWMG